MNIEDIKPGDRLSVVINPAADDPDDNQYPEPGTIIIVKSVDPLVPYPIEDTNDLLWAFDELEPE